jgi:hypothetical protein
MTGALQGKQQLRTAGFVWACEWTTVTLFGWLDKQSNNKALTERKAHMKPLRTLIVRYRLRHASTASLHAWMLSGKRLYACLSPMSFGPLQKVPLTQYGLMTYTPCVLTDWYITERQPSSSSDLCMRD